MSGFRISKRCDYCRKRHFKCDQHWPCGPCRRINGPCSGPPASYSRFIANEKSSGAASSVAGGISEDDRTLLPGPIVEEITAAKRPLQESVAAIPSNNSLTILRRRPAKTGPGNYLVLKAKARSSLTPSPSAPPRTREDLLASRVVQCIDAGAGSDSDIRLRISWIHLTVPRFSSSLALYEATNLLLSSWISFSRNPTSNPEIDRGAYVKALNALNTALSDLAKSYTTETLAATALVYRVEFDYDMARGANKSSHSTGLSALMSGKGPPCADNELDVRLCFENFSILVTHFILERKDNFFARPEWLKAMRDGIKKNTIREDPLWSGCELAMYMIHWPDLTKGLRTLAVDPDPRQAHNLIGKAGEVARGLANFEKTYITHLWEHGHIWEVIDPEARWIWIYEFDSCEHCEIYHQHALTAIAVNRVLQRALAITGKEEPAVEARILKYSERIWKTLPYIERMSRTVRDNFLAPLVMSLESADPDVRRYLAQRIMAISGPRAQLVGEHPESAFMGLCRALTGRSPRS